MLKSGRQSRPEGDENLLPRVPTIVTERLTLREPNLADWPPFSALWVSDRAQYMGGPLAEPEAWGQFCHGIALWRLHGLGNLAIQLRATGACIGQVEVNQGPRFPEAELGWQLSAEAEGKGYAFEAAAAFRDWVFQNNDFACLVSDIDPDNGRSIALAQRLGAVLDKTAAKQDPGDLVFRHKAVPR